MNDTEEIYATRTEFRVLVRLINDELQRSIEAADITIQSLRVALSKSGSNESIQHKPTRKSNRNLNFKSSDCNALPRSSRTQTG